MRSVLAPAPYSEPQVVLAVLRVKPGGPESVHVARVTSRQFKSRVADLAKIKSYPYRVVVPRDYSPTYFLFFPFILHQMKLSTQLVASCSRPPEKPFMSSSLRT